MNENLDLVKILEGCPKGTEFYSLIYGKVRFERIVENVSYPIILSICNDRCDEIYVTKKGLHYKDCNGECVLFPSKDQRDWSKFERFWDTKVEKFDPKTLHPFDKVLARSRICDCWNALIFSHMDFKHEAVCCEFSWEQCIPYNEETKDLVGTNEDCPEHYIWWEE